MNTRSFAGTLFNSIGKAISVFLIGLAINLIGYFIIQYFWPVELGTVWGISRIILLWIAFPFLFLLMGYRFMVSWFARQVYIRISPNLRPALEGSLRYLKERNGGKKESREQVHQLEEKVRSLVDRVPSFFIGFILAQFRQIPLLKFLPKGKDEPTAEELESAYFELNAYILEEFFQASFRFLYWLIPLNIFAMIALVFFRG